MKRIFKLFMIVITIMTITGCASRESVHHYSEKRLIRYVENNINEKVELLSSNTQDENRYIYTFNLVDRNITFQVEDYIINDGLNIDATQFYDDYKQGIALSDYAISIMKNLEQERIVILEKYGFKEEYYDLIGSHIIEVNDYSDLSDLSNYIVELDNLYQFNIKNFKSEKFGYISLADVISFSKTDCSIEGISYSSTKTRLTYKDVYATLEKQYINQLKKFNLTDNTVPNKVWNKY